MSRSKMIAQMREEVVDSGFLTAHLARLRKENPEGADLLEADLAEIFSTDKGLRVLKLFEKSILLFAFPPGTDDRALRELNAIQHFVLEIRRYVAHGQSS